MRLSRALSGKHGDSVQGPVIGVMSMAVSEERKKRYLSCVCGELRRRGLWDEDIPFVIGKTGFMSAMNENPEEQMHCSPEAAASEILLTAARRSNGTPLPHDAETPESPECRGMAERVPEEQKKRYLSYIYEEMRSRGLTGEEIPRIIGQTGFMMALNEFPEEQLHYSPEAAAGEILPVAAAGWCVRRAPDEN